MSRPRSRSSAIGPISPCRPRSTADRDALLFALAAILDGAEWSADTCDEIARVLQAAGYLVRDVDDRDPFDVPRLARSAGWRDVDDEPCRTCGASYPAGGDGFDGECPPCADRTDTARLDDEPDAPTVCARCGLPVTHDGRGSWVDATDGDGCGDTVHRPR